jgi:hypothetical protein
VSDILFILLSLQAIDLFLKCIMLEVLGLMKQSWAHDTIGR